MYYYQRFKDLREDKDLNQSEIAKLLGSDDEELIDIYFSENYSLIETNNIIITSRLIEGEFFAYQNTIPAESKYVVKVNCFDFKIFLCYF